jgi:hypothetical protein
LKDLNNLLDLSSSWGKPLEFVENSKRAGSVLVVFAHDWHDVESWQEYLIQNLSFLSTGHDQIKLRELSVQRGDELEEAVVPCLKRTSKRLVVERYGQGSYWVR